MRKQEQGFSLIELVIVVAVISILLSFFLDRVWYYQELAEKTAMEQDVDAIQSALTMQHGKRYVNNDQPDINLLATQNPVKWLQKLPKNYVGEFYDPSPLAVPRGSWMFDLKARELIYVLSRTDHFVPGKDGKQWIRFHVRIEYDPVVHDGTATGGKELVGTVFEPVENVKWF
jgi:general secretion pathway protein G